MYNHFNWLPELQERSEQLLSIVGREKRLSLSLARQEPLVRADRQLPPDSSAGSVGGDKEGGVQGDATGRCESGGDKKSAESTQKYLLRSARAGDTLRGNIQLDTMELYYAVVYMHVHDCFHVLCMLLLRRARSVVWSSFVSFQL